MGDGPVRRVLCLLFLATLTLAACGGDDDDADASDDDASPADDDDDADDDASPADDDDSSPGDDDDNDDNDDDATPADAWRWFYDEQGRVTILRGPQIIQSSPPYISWHTRDDYARLREWGFNTIRLGIVWAAVEPERGAYDEDFLAQLDERLGWCGELGVSVILDMHQDLYGERFNGDGAPVWATIDNGIPYNPIDPWFLNYAQPAVMAAFNNLWRNTDGIQDAFIAMWTHLAARYANEPALAGYDLFNEPFFGTYLPLIRFDRQALTPFYQKLIASMQAVDPNHRYFVEPAGAVGAGLPCYFEEWDLPNVAYAPHLYPALPNAFNLYFGDTRNLRWILRQVEKTASHMKTPFWVGEWALFNDETLNHELFMRDATRLLDEHRASWLYWIYNKDDNVGLLDADGAERDWVLKEVSRPYPQKVCGYPDAFSFDSDTKHFELSWRENPAADGPTVVYVPERRHYPNGFTVECSDEPGAWSYEWDDEAQLLTVSADRVVPQHLLTINAVAP